MDHGATEKGTRPDLRFAILGSFECWADGSIIALRGPLQERLAVSLLLNRNRVVPVSRLVETIWEDGGPETAAHQVRKMTSDLRKRVPGMASLLTTSGVGYRIRVPEETLDLGIFTAALSDARRATEEGDLRSAAAKLRLALDQWRGPVLGGEGGPVIQAMSTALEERRLTALEQLFAIRLDLGEASRLVGDLREAVGANPVREHLRGQLMRALYLSGRQTDALAEYQSLRQYLDEEHGVEPGAELAELQQRILRNDASLGSHGEARRETQVAVPAPASTAAAGGFPTTLPYDLPDFTGRQEALDAVCAAGQPSGSGAHRLRIVLIDGMAGSGKTALAVHAAHFLQESHPDGQLYLDLHGFTPERDSVDTHEALGILLGALGISGSDVPVDPEARIARWRTATVNRRMLLVFDDAESAAQIRGLLPSSSESTVLITSRVRIKGIDGARAVSLGVLSPAESLSLLERVLGRERVANESEAAMRLADLCGHLPLALRISAARLASRDHWTIARLASRLSNESRKLVELAVEDRSIRACIKSSLEALDQEHLEYLRYFCLHPGDDVEIHAAAALTGLDVYGAEDIVELLLDRHLMEPRLAERYTVHSLVRAYVLEQYTDPEGEGPAFERLTNYYRTAICRATDAAFPGRSPFSAGLPAYEGDVPELEDRSLALAWVDAEYRNILPSLAEAVRRGSYPPVVESARNLIYHLHLRGRSDAFLEAATLGVASSRQTGDPASIRMSLVNLAVAYWHRGDLPAGLVQLREALEVATASGDRAGQAVCLGRLGTFYSTLGDLRAAVEHLERSIPMHLETGNLKEVAEARFHLSSAFNTLGRYEDAAAQAEAAVAVNQELSSPSTLIMALVNLGTAQTGLGLHHEALGTLSEALEWEGRLGGSMSKALILARMVPACRSTGARDAAAQFARQAAEAVRAPHTSPMHRVAVLDLLGEHALKENKLSAARELFTEAIELSEDLGLRLDAAWATAGLAGALAAAGEDGDAQVLLHRSDPILADIGLPEKLRRRSRG
ncbi:transcriptional regulator, SARP family [Catenulispora acidiphila DSM 44928]|uniref:Transcriptional regulator, SARP family n=1 Tax=Catenulispora acidiphila (strain DSM 44928 / JCM 14897 / NBRC 102108 / NRRL B-24433 / ID139908) TaxID=479433 RepID=C7QK63_CATAD|nr:BTAD domain-containing putative transcriptional regulator [Catenulispora acidiphila]ACU75137.1 transcriptional regulator, SARP family [Catenulispora acidiphila DSM 44928]